MKSAIFVAVCLNAAVACTAAVAGIPVAPVPQGAAILPVAYGDGPATGRHHKSRGKATPATTAAVPDMHGATKEDADKAYRKKYGF